MFAALKTGIMRSPFLLLLLPILALVPGLSSSAAASERVVRIHKKARQMTFSVDGKVVRRFEIALGGAPQGDKEKRGDQKTPEGEFYVSSKNAQSSFHRFIELSYPMPRHAERGKKSRVISARQKKKILAAAEEKKRPPQNTRLGGWIGIHGGGAGSDWTLGCIAVSDEEAEWLFRRMKRGDRIVVLP